MSYRWTLVAQETKDRAIISTGYHHDKFSLFDYLHDTAMGDIYINSISEELKFYFHEFLN